MIDDLAILESEDIEAHLGAEDVVVGMREDQITVLEDPHRIDLRRTLGKLLQERDKPGQAVDDPQVVLNVLFGVDIGDGFRVAGFNALEHFDDLLILWY